MARSFDDDPIHDSSTMDGLEFTSVLDSDTDPDVDLDDLNIVDDGRGSLQVTSTKAENPASKASNVVLTNTVFANMVFTSRTDLTDVY